ncbi:hypothetical protein G7B40_023055 [Aetokthonos hydrillicola Thurmond2011]|jgi:hypothetical protein|uniref:Carboxypeptidase regulatory-like domain-containing protein n=1 Tax=Aetokthonos hydrillicola Thurmond2011 TaxID=2712845 RepID=A0AAP5MBQ8_9CYAN|nr:carboxypeptidase-like regulatory domain-containing protein [Aetokthonos hydrillicola]MDR9897423.1 hypothetical protein [Aetokthonos hydrillicola Thurmond2011]
MPKNQGINFLGRVVDQHKHAPISGAKILLNFPGAPSVVYSDLEGIYRFTAKFNGNSSLDGKLTIEAKGYETYESFITLLPDKKDLVDIQLVSGNVRSRTVETRPAETRPAETRSAETRSAETRPAETRPVENRTVENREVRSNESSMLLPILLTVLTALALLVVVATKPSNQRPSPEETPQEIPQKIDKKPRKSRKNRNYVSDNLVSQTTIDQERVKNREFP